MGKKRVGKVVLGAKIIHVVKVRPTGMTTWYRPSCYDLHTWHDAMEAVSYWIKANDLEKLVRAIEITTTVKWDVDPWKPGQFYSAVWPRPFECNPIGLIVVPTTSDSASSGS